MAKDDDFLEDAREEFEECVEHEADNRKDSLDDLRFARLAEQWDERDKKQRETDGRPCLTINRLPAFIRQVVNDARQNSPSIAVHAVDSKGDPDTAEIIAGLIRNIETQSDADVAYDTALEFAVTMGFGYWRINTEYATDDTFDLDIRIKQIANPFTVYGDPYHDGPDSSEWNLAFVVDQMSKSAFERRFKGAETVDWSSEAYTGLRAPWIDGERVQVAERWAREEVTSKLLLLSDGNVIKEDDFEHIADFMAYQGVKVISSRLIKSHLVTQVIMSGAEVLERRKWAGKYIPIVPVYGEDLNVEGKRHLRSMVRDAKDPQRMFNAWRTFATESVAMAPKTPFIGAVGQFATDADKWATANTASHAYIEYDHKGGLPPPQRQPFAGVPAGALQEALNASDDMKAIMGMFDASLGAQGNETSGRAIIARQREGDVGSFHFIDNLRRSIRHTGRILLDLIPKIYDSERVVRIMGIDGEAQTVPINQPVMVQGQPQPGQDPSQMQAVQKIFDLTTGKYDLTVETGPSYSTQRQEAASQMIELVRAFPGAAPIIGDLIAKNLDWPGADEIAKRLEGLMQQQLQQHNAPAGTDPKVVEQIQALMQKVQQLSQENQALKTDKSVEMQANQIKAFDAGTKRLKVVADASKPSHLPRQTPN